jgi:hypothetical protein
MLSETLTRLDTPNQMAAMPAARLEMIFASTEEALARAEASLRKALAARRCLVARTLVQDVAFDAIIWESYPEQN